MTTYVTPVLPEAPAWADLNLTSVGPPVPKGSYLSCRPSTSHVHRPRWPPDMAAYMSGVRQPHLSEYTYSQKHLHHGKLQRPDCGVMLVQGARTFPRCLTSSGKRLLDDTTHQESAPHTQKSISARSDITPRKKLNELDFSKLPKYNWIPASARQLPKVPDFKYRTSFKSAETIPPYVIGKSPRVPEQKPKSAGHSLKKSRNFLKFDLSPEEVRENPEADSVSRTKLESPPPVVRVQSFLRPESRDQGSEDTYLYAQVQQSINALTHSQTSNDDVIGVDRPIRREKGTYRPVSNISLKPLRIAVRSAGQRNHKSVEPYLKIVNDGDTKRYATGASLVTQLPANDIRLLQPVIDCNRADQESPSEESLAPWGPGNRPCSGSNLALVKGKALHKI